ncbi:MAG: hypothetical protein V4714_10985 [Bacteroidota bacterium]
MVNKLKNYFLLLRVQKALRDSVVSRGAIGFGRAKNIGILFDANFEGKDAQAINMFYKRLRDEGKNVKSLTYFPQERSSPFDFKFDFFTSKDLTMLGDLKTEVVDRFVNTDFDYLYCINSVSFLPFDYILAQSKARFRVGVYQEEKSELFELMINPLEGQDLASIIDQMFSFSRRISENGEISKATQ